MDERLEYICDFRTSKELENFFLTKQKNLSFSLSKPREFDVRKFKMELKESFAAGEEPSMSLDDEGNFLENSEKPQRIRTEGQRVTAVPMQRTNDGKSRMYILEERAANLMHDMLPFTLEKDDQ